MAIGVRVGSVPLPSATPATPPPAGVRRRSQGAGEERQPRPALASPELPR